MRIRHLAAVIIAAMPVVALADNDTPAYEIAGKDTVCQIFIYSPGERSGLHLAYLTDNGRWTDVGQLCASDYAQWGAEKRMYNPYVVHANDGSWRAVWSVNNYSPCFAAAYSEDLITWRPQDYPKVSVKGVSEPIAFAMDDGTFDIYFKAKDGKHYVKGSKDFRHFTETPGLSTIEDVAWTRDTATVGDKLFGGNGFEVPKVHLDYIRSFFQAVGRDAALSSETMRDDGKRFAALPSKLDATLNVSVRNQKPISDKLVGVFFEDISYAADGGLYAEMVQNRDFEYSQGDRREWNATTAWSSATPIIIGEDKPLSKNNPHYAVLTADTLFNSGWDGFCVEADSAYKFSFYVRNIDVDKKNFIIGLKADGRLIASAKIKTRGQEWTRYEAVLRPEVSAKKAELVVLPLKKGSSAVDMISLFPADTYKGHGLRRDLAETIANLKPKFVRFPGGCMSHGQGIDNIYHWNETVGPWQDRKPAKNIWNYHQTRGLGFYEYFQFCEDMGAEPLPVLAAGVPCQNSAPNSEGYGGQQGGIPMEDMPAYCQEIFDMIEWANGDPATSKWAKMRADAGHPAPFNLKYIGIGNEDIISTVFEERCLMICKAIREKYPDIIICGTVGPFHDPSADYIEGWDFARKHKDVIDMVDEHYYESTGWFVHHQDYYDNYDRNAPKVYLGEYASRTRTVESALAEAMHLCAIERNGDVVAMTSYAPLLCRDGHSNWNPDLIYFGNGYVTTTPSYETQRMFSVNEGDRYVDSKISVSQADSLNYRTAASVVKDSKSGRYYVKLVNSLPSELTVHIEGMPVNAGSKVEYFCGKPGDKSVKVEHTTVGSNNVITLKPYSVSVIEL